MILRKLPFALQKRGLQLLHQQCSLWGQDVRRPEGNLLLQQGFERVRAPKGISGCSQYTLQLEDGLRLRLWGFGFFIGGDEGVYVNRYSFTPRRIAMPDNVWEARYFARASYSQEYGLLSKALRCIVRSEETVLRDVGLRYREQCLFSLDKGVLGPHELIAAWRDLEQQLQRFALTASRHAARDLEAVYEDQERSQQPA